MKTHLLITVDCGKTTCGKCELWHYDNGRYCKAFGCGLFTCENISQRCPACLRAEKGARK